MALTYRYPGTKSFSFEEQSIFFGRDEDISNITTSVIVNSTTVLFGKSGTGKSSIIQAGLIPKLQGAKKNEEEENEESNEDNNAINEEVNQEPGSENIDEEKANPYLVINVMPKLFEKDKELSKEIDKIIINGIKTDADILKKLQLPGAGSLWFQLKQFQYQQVLENKSQTLLLIFDQAEELFTYPDSQIEMFVKQLYPVIGQFMPPEFQKIINRTKSLLPDTVLDKELDTMLRVLHSPLPVKFLFSIRSDKLHLITRLKKASPHILQNSYELLPLNKAQAFEAIDKPSHKRGKFYSNKFEITGDAKEFIFEKLSAQVNDREYNFEEALIEPFSLQIICSHIEKNSVEAKNMSKIQVGDFDEPEKIIKGYYLDCINSLPSSISDKERENARNLIELKMISDKWRIPIHESLISGDEKYPVALNILDALVTARILKKDISTSGGSIYEITHDCFLVPILTAKMERLGKTPDDKSQETINELLKKIEDKLNGHNITKDVSDKDAVLLQKVQKEKKLGKTTVTSSASVTDDFELYDLFKKLGDAYCVTKDYSNAIENFNKALETPNQNNKSFLIETYRSRSDAYYFIGNYERSSSDLKKLLELDPGDYVTQTYLLDNYDKQNRLEEGVAFFNQDLKIEMSAALYTEIGNKFFSRKEYEKAMSFYRETLQLDPKAEYAYLNLGLAEENLGNDDEALINYKKSLDIKPDYEDALVSMARVFFDKKDYPKAEVLCKRLIDKEPNNEKNYNNLGLIYEAMGFWEQSISNYKKAIELNPSYEIPYSNLVKVYYDMNKPEGAVRELQQAIKRNPEFAYLYGLLGNLYDDLGEKEKAVNETRNAVRLNSADPFYHRVLGYLLIGFGPQYLEEAFNEFQYCIRIDPRDRYAQASLGGCYRRLGNETEYRRQVEIVSGLTPMAPEDEYVQASIEALCGNTNKANHLLKIALEKQLRSKKFVRNDTDFDFLRDDPEFKELVA